MKKGIFWIVCLFICVSCSVAVSADTTEYNLAIYEENQYISSVLGDRENRGGVFDKSGTHSVDGATGTLSYTATDLHLPGKGGLDVTLTRSYNSSMQEVSDVEGVDFDYTRKCSWFPAERRKAGLPTTSECYQFAYAYHPIGSTAQVLVVFRSEAEMIASENRNREIYVSANYAQQGKSGEEIDGFKLVSGQAPHVQFDSTFYFYSDIKSSGSNMVRLVRDTSLPCVYLTLTYNTRTPMVQVADPDMGNQIGYGWRITHPYCQMETTVPVNPGTSSALKCDVYGIFTTEKGDTIPFVYRKQNYKSSDGFGINQCHVLQNNREHYLYGWDISVLGSDSGVRLRLAQYKDDPDCEYNMRVTDPEGITRYYDIDRNKLVAIEDRFGNEIRYYYAGGNVQYIKDTYGRYIRFRYSGDYTLKSISLTDSREPVPDFEKILVTYRLENINNENTDPTNMLKSDDTYVLTVYRGTTDSADKVSYVHNMEQNIVQWGGLNYTRVNWNMLLNEVRLDDNTKKKYDYEVKEVFLNRSPYKTTKGKVKKEYIIIGEEEQQACTYAYDNSREGISDLSEGYTHTTQITNSAGVQKNTYNYKQQLAESRLLSNNVLTKTG